MASFFQPSGYAPETADYTHFQISWNSLLSKKELTTHWYQDLVVALGSCALVLGCTIFLIHSLRSRGGVREILCKKPYQFLKHLAITSKRLSKQHSRPYELLSEKHSSSQSRDRVVDSPPVLKHIKSFSITEQHETTDRSQLLYDLNITQLPGADLEQAFNQPTAQVQRPRDSAKRSSNRSISSWIASLSDRSSKSHISSITASTNEPIDVAEHSKVLALRFGALSLATGFSGPYAPDNEAEVTRYINRLRQQENLDGIVISWNDSDSAAFLNNIAWGLRQQNVPVILTGDPDLPILDSINLGLVNGVIVQNASILASGQRRDFFNAARLRDCVARCNRQRKAIPTFFLGFLEIWDVRPSAATLRRAHKLADFFGAVIEVQSRIPDQQQALPRGMCLSGFDWLKKAEIVQLQKSWTQLLNNQPSEAASQTAELDLSLISDILPSVKRFLHCYPLPEELLVLSQETHSFVEIGDHINNAPPRSDFWNVSSCGVPLCHLGCFSFQEEITNEQYDAILRIQRDLKEHRMLHTPTDIEILRISGSLKSILETSAYTALLRTLIEDLGSGQVKVYKGLDSGFTLPDDGGHVWAVSDLSDSATIDLYVSLKCHDDAATIWHTFLAHHGVPRLNRFEEELLLSQADRKQSQLPTSIEQELRNATEAELMYLMEQIRVSGLQHPFVDPIMKISKDLLIQETSRRTWNVSHSEACLQGKSSIQSVFKLRLEHHARSGAEQLPKIEELVLFYELLEQKIEESLFFSDRTTLNALSALLLDAYKLVDGTVLPSPVVDLYGLMFFCALRKLAFEDVYLETTDRCPFFLSQPDQAGVFAELWVLGSQCEIYFGLQPRALGEIIYERYRKRLTCYPPPPESWNGKDVFTAYSVSDPSIRIEGYPVLTGSGSPTELPSNSTAWRENQPRSTMKLRSAASKLGAMSIFCLPAIIDVLLLTFLGRGFYLTAFMDPTVRIMANYAILTSLIMTGGVTGFVGSTGGFYLFSFAFDNMTHFLVQRFSAAFMLTSVVALCGFFAFGSQYSWFDGLVFVLYLIALTTFLNVLGMLATMHRPGSPLTSGRIAMWRCLGILFISPILSTFVNGSDLLIYLLVIYTFIFVLLVTFRNICHEWTTWQTKVPTIKEKDLLTWYRNKKPEETAEYLNMQPSVLAASARAALRSEVQSVQQRSSILALFTFRRSVDEFVEKMALGLPFALWLLEKESNGEELPEMFTTTWFVQLELALANQRQLTRGLKEHSSFITYRYSKYDLGQNVGLFLGALMDRLIDICMSARRPAAIQYFDDRARYGICFGLLYFLCGAVAVDIVLQHYWPYARMLSEKKLTNLDDYSQIIKSEEQQRKKRYRSALLELASLLSMVFGVTTILMWAFVIDHKSVILYFTSISAYTGVLLFQFHRCFTRNPRAHVLTVFCACLVGFIVGCILRALPYTADFFYDFAIGHNTATFSAAIGTFLFTGYFKNPFRRSAQAQAVVIQSDQKNYRIITSKDGNDDRTVSHLNDGPCNMIHTTNRDILRHLCLNLDINVRWSRLPEDVRQLILCRVLGLPAQMTLEVSTWLSEELCDMRQHDENLKRCIGLFSAREDTAQGPVVVHTEKRFTSCQRGPELTSAYYRQSPHCTFIGGAARFIVRALDVIVKWTAIISAAAPDTNRELWYAMRDNKMRPVNLWLLLKIWKLCWWMKNFCLYVFLIAGKRPLGRLLSLVRHGAPRTLQANTIIVDTPLWQMSGFITRDQNADLNVIVYDGLHTQPPQGKVPVAIAAYDSSHRLVQRQVFSGADSKPVTTSYQYEEDTSNRWAVSKVTLESGQELKSSYDKYGRAVRGKIIRGNLEFDFEFLYRKRPKGNSEILKATYTSVQNMLPISISAFWCVRPRVGSQTIKNWIPSDKIQRVIATMNGNTYEMKWTYKHARGPEIHTSYVNKQGVLTPCLAPAPILQDEYGFLEKPKHPSFDYEDLLIYHPLHWVQKLARIPVDVNAPKWTSRLASMMPFGLPNGGKKIIYRKLPTSVLRTALWTSWGKAPYLDAVSACFLDEMILRKEPLLRRYWHLRDAGHLYQATDVLDESLEEIISTIEPSHESSQTCPLLIKSADLFTMGLGKDANQLTARLEDAYHDTSSTTSVIFSDNGCWPDNPGGVSNCRRDLVNGHSTIRGHCLAESANDFGIPRYQIERNVNSLKVLPLWGLDGKTPYHGLLDNLLQSQVDEKIVATKVKEDIEGVFIPLLKLFVRGARSKRYTRQDLIVYTNVILKISRYFERCDYNKTWNSDEVWNAWIEAWLFDYNDPNISSARDYFKIEQPTMQDFRSALDLYICYFFIYSVEAPEKCPTVFQSTHHGISSLYGMLLKYRRGTTWGIWDHAILWRETCLNISPAQCLLPIPVQAMLLAGVKLACHLAYTHVDIVLPCTSVFNPDWEQDLGTDQGIRGSKKLFARKIDPIVNGIGNMDAFQPITETRSKFPTTVMLSNVQFIKDVKNAVLAADIIINTYGFDDYRLVIYGAQDRQPSYALETETLINTRGLAGKVILAGFGSPKEVLKDAWIFMNSSLSEGLPLAIGEAALSGVPIVATEVGATALVLTDPDDVTKRYGEVVPPNDPEALARAQLSILAMLGPWAEYTEDKGQDLPLPDQFTTEDVRSITKRMFDKADDRRGLGLKLRDVVLRSFHGHRYLREHEQMYWIQRRRAEIRRAAKRSGQSMGCELVIGEKNVFEYDSNGDTEEEARPQWQKFDVKLLTRRGQSRPQKLAIGSSVAIV